MIIIPYNNHDLTRLLSNPLTTPDTESNVR